MRINAHSSMPGFGYDENLERSKTVLNSLLSQCDGWDAIKSQVVGNIAYQQFFGIHNYNGTDKERSPINSVCLHPKENYNSFAPMHKRIWDFGECRVGEYFNISYKEFKDLTTEEIETILDFCRKQIKKDAATYSDIEKGK